jgi:hypothetical protein
VRKADRSKTAASGGLSRLQWLSIAVVLLVPGAYFWISQQQTEVSPAAEIKETDSAQLPAVTIEEFDFKMLQGRWLRPDGGYVLEFRSIDSAGRIKAFYYNPRPVNVATARVQNRGSTVRVYVELRDQGYPGSYYDLVFDPQKDQMTGNYFQAVQQANYPVMFVRMDAENGR